MGFQYPHVGVSGCLVKAVAVCIALRREHDLIQFAHTKGALLSTGKHFGLKQETTVDIDDYLVCTDEVYVQ